MRTLRLVALSDDEKSLILAPEGGDDGERLVLPIDDRVARRPAATPAGSARWTPMPATRCRRG